MQLDLTPLVAFLGTAVTFWLAAYLLARGFPSRVTLRAVLVMVALGAYFFNGYVNSVNPDPASTPQRAVLVVWAMVAWYDLIDKFIPGRVQGWRAVRVAAAYGLGLVATVMLATHSEAVPSVNGTTMWSARAPDGLPYVTVAVVHLLLLSGTFYNFVLMRRAGGGLHTRFFLAATILAALTTLGYYVLARPGMPGVPTAVQGILLLGAVGLFGYAVARHQALLERHTSLQEFPISGLVIVGLASLYAYLAQQRGFNPTSVAGIAVLAVLTHSGVDLAREFLARWLHNDEAKLRQQLRRLGRNVGGDLPLPVILRDGLEVLCKRLSATGGFVALRQGGSYVVAATLRSRPVGSQVEGGQSDDLTPAGHEVAGSVAWLAPVTAGGEQVAVIGLGAPHTARRDYSEAELDVLAEMADWVGMMVTSDRQQHEARQRLADLAAEALAREAEAPANPEEVLSSLGQAPPPEFVHLVEEALRHVSDYTVLGESPLAAQLRVTGPTHVERGKVVRERLIQALDTLRPAGRRPAEPLPREWHGYAVLADAYLEDVPNREIMARLYVSQGTFNRARRKALQAVARNLMELHSSLAAA